MAPASESPGYGQPATFRRRATSFTLAALANGLLLLMLLTLATPAGTQRLTIDAIPDNAP